MSPKRRDHMRTADILFSKLIRSRGECESDRGTHSGSLQCAHIISRSYKSIRTYEKNALCLCQGCHVYFTHHPLEWRRFIDGRFPGRWDELTDWALQFTKVDWRAEVERLRSVGSVVDQ